MFDYGRVTVIKIKETTMYIVPIYSIHLKNILTPSDIKIKNFN